jgi:hypothetical protein
MISSNSHPVEPVKIEKLFDTGDYLTVAIKGSKDDWRTYAALGLIGKTEEAIQGLSRFNTQEASFYLAVSYWMANEEGKAVEILKTISTAHAKNLLSLINKPKIEVLAQLPWNRSAGWDLLTAASQDSKFQVKNISFHPEDLPNEPYADIHKFYHPQSPPDFYVCSMVEWHFIPPNLQQLPCPIFGNTSDYDVHIQTVYPWLQIFDEIIVLASSEWHILQKLAIDIPISVYPKCLGVPDRLIPIHNQSRELDLFLSGTVLHPYHPDKAKLFQQVLTIPDIKIQVVNGFESESDYYKNLSRAKVCYTYVRFANRSFPDASIGIVTRGLEALSMGCAVAVQAGSALTIYADEEHGVLTYQPDNNDLPLIIQKILRQWPEFKEKAKRGAEIIRREFAISKVASQYLRFLTFLAAKPRPQRQIRKLEYLYQKRSILQKGWLPSYDFFDSPVLKRIGFANNQKLQSQINSGNHVSSRLFIDIIRESVLYNYHKILYKKIPVQLWLPDIINFFKAGLTHFPDSLVLRFNFIRVVLHFGQPKEVTEAIELAKETLDLPSSSWQIDLMEDVFPWDFCSCFFNYRKYFDLVTEALVTEDLIKENSIKPALIKIILASIYYYKGFYAPYQGYYSESINYFKQAASLDPEFPYYKFQYAQQLLERGFPEDIYEAGNLLLELVAKNSGLFIEASLMLKSIQDLGLFHCPQLAELTHVLAQVESQITFISHGDVPALKPGLIAVNEFVNPDEILKQLKSSYLEKLHQKITGIESSKFWKITRFWLPSKYHLSLNQADLEYYKNNDPQKGIRELQARIQKAENSKIWQLRKQWFRVKSILGLTIKED